LPPTPTVWDVVQEILIQKPAAIKPYRLSLYGLRGRKKLLCQGGFERVAGDAGVLVRVVRVGDVLLKHAMGIEE
jgi:hypothetical protein